MIFLHVIGFQIFAMKFFRRKTRKMMNYATDSQSVTEKHQPHTQGDFSVMRSQKKPHKSKFPRRSPSSRCWTALWTWWKRHGGQWVYSGDARSRIARSSTTGGVVLASRRTHAKEALAPPPSPRRTAHTLQRRVGIIIFSHDGVPQKPAMLSAFLWLAPVVHKRGLFHAPWDDPKSV